MSTWRDGGRGQERGDNRHDKKFKEKPILSDF